MTGKDEVLKSGWEMKAVWKIALLPQIEAGQGSLRASGAAP